RTCTVPSPHRPSLASRAPAAQPEGRLHVGTNREVGRRVAPENAYPPSLAQRALRRQSPKVGAVCPNRARTDLCGGCSVMGVPTAIFRLAERRPSLAHAMMASLICWSFSNSMFRYLLVDHAVPAMWRSLAAARPAAGFLTDAASRPRLRFLCFYGSSSWVPYRGLRSGSTTLR